MKEKILKLREEGKSYSEIRKILNCSKSTISYYCGEGQKEKAYQRVKNKRDDKFLEKIERYKSRNTNLKFRDFQRRGDGHKLKSVQEKNFTLQEAKEKIGNNPRCYLTGEFINLNNPQEYNLDHIIPVDKGGKNTLDNLGLLKSDINKMKSNLTVEELIENCIKILRYNGYEVSANK